MKKEKSLPKEISYNISLNKAENFEQANAIFEKMKAENVKPDQITYNTLISKSENFEQAKAIFDEMKQGNLKPNEIIYSSLLNKVPTLEQQKSFYQGFLQKFPFKKDDALCEKNYSFLFTALFKKVKNKEHFAFVKSEISRLGLKLNDYTKNFYDNLEKRYK